MATARGSMLFAHRARIVPRPFSSVSTSRKRLTGSLSFASRSFRTPACLCGHTITPAREGRALDEEAAEVLEESGS